MYPTWSIVFAALIAGALGGFLIPERPQSKPAAVATAAKETAEKVSNPVKSTTASPVQPAQQRTERTEPTAQAAAEQKQAPKTAAESCAIESWPYRAAGCLDRTASTAPARLTVNARRVDPAVSLRDMSSAGNEMAAAKQKAPAPPAQEAAPTRAEANTAESTAAIKKPKRRTYRPPAPYFVEEGWRGRERVQERGQERVYFRGHDGRFYLAPEYRPGPPPVYYIR